MERAITRVSDNMVIDMCKVNLITREFDKKICLFLEGVNNGFTISLDSNETRDILFDTLVEAMEQTGKNG